jgi:WD40 repeat protein
MSRFRITKFLAISIILIAEGTAASQDKPRRTDLVGDPLPEGAIARIGTTRYRLQGWRSQLFFSADGDTLTSVGSKGSENAFQFLEAATGKTLGEVSVPDMYSSSADQSPDGKYLAVIGTVRSDKPPFKIAIRVYDLATRKEVWTVQPADQGRSSGGHVRFTPDGKRLVTMGGDIRVWDAKSGDELIRQKLAGVSGNETFDISPDGKTIAVGYYKHYLWDWEKGTEPRQIDTGLRSGAEFSKFSPDGRTLYLIGAGTGMRAVDVATGTAVNRLETGPHAAWISFSPNGTTYAVGYYSTTTQIEGYVSLRETATGTETVRLPCGSDQAGVGAWSRDGRRFAAMAGSRIWVWDIMTRKVLGPDVPAHTGSISELEFAPDGRLFTASIDHTVRAWDPATGKQLLNLSMDGWARGLAISHDGSLVAGNALRNDLRIWDSRSGKQIFRLHGHGMMGGLRRAKFSSDDQTLLTFGDDCYLRVWDVLTGKLKAEHFFRPKSYMTGKDADDEELERMELLFDAFRTMDLGPDGNTLALATGKNVRIIAAETGKDRFEFEADPQSVSLVSFSPDGKRLATAGPGVVPPKPKPGQMPERPKDYQVSVWDLAEARPLVQFRVPGSSFGGMLVFTPDGRSLVTSKDNVLSFWDSKTGAATGTVALPERVIRIAFDGPGKRLAVAFGDTTVLVFDLLVVLKPAKKE